MAEEHAFDRLTKAERSEREAREEADGLVARVKSIAGRLATWERVGFEGKLNDGLLKALPGSVVIRLDELPTLESIHAAIQKWRRADSEARSVLNSLTDDQLRTLGRSRD